MCKVAFSLFSNFNLSPCSTLNWVLIHQSNFCRLLYDHHQIYNTGEDYLKMPFLSQSSHVQSETTCSLLYFASLPHYSAFQVNFFVRKKTIICDVCVCTWWQTLYYYYYWPCDKVIKTWISDLGQREQCLWGAGPTMLNMQGRKYLFVVHDTMLCQDNLQTW